VRVKITKSGIESGEKIVTVHKSGTATPSRIVEAKYRMTYADGEPGSATMTVVLGENTMSESITASNVWTDDGAAITGTYTGSWAYVYEGDTKIGFVVYLEDSSKLLILGKTSASGSLSDMSEYFGVTGINVSDMSDTYSFGGQGS
jgi:hypothetical protein